MSHINAFGCDICGQIKDEKEMVGVSAQPDLFNVQAGFKTVYNNAKGHAHYCTECYSSHVIIPAGNEFNRKNNEEGYIKKSKELGFLLRQTAIRNRNEKKFFKRVQ